MQFSLNLTKKRKHLFDRKVLYNHRVSMATTGRIWIGLYDAFQTDQFYWVNNASVSSIDSHWGPGPPDHHNRGGDQDWGHISPAAQLFHDRECHEVFNYLCERQV